MDRTPKSGSSSPDDADRRRRRETPEARDSSADASSPSARDRHFLGKGQRSEQTSTSRISHSDTENLESLKKLERMMMMVDMGKQEITREQRERISEIRESIAKYKQQHVIQSTHQYQFPEQPQREGKEPGRAEGEDRRAMGEDGKPVPRAFNLSSEATPEHPILPGGMKSVKKLLMCETSQGSDDALRDQAHLHYEQHEYDNAKQLYEDVLANNKWKSGRNPRETAMAMSNLATIYTMQRNFQQATLWYRRALPIYERELGLDHHRTEEVRAKLSLGQQLGHYLLVDLLGQGGFANVYLGKHAHLPNRRAAVKVLHQAHLAEQKDRDEFYKEAQTLFDLKHPHIVRVQDFGVKGGVPFLVMEYAPNGTLHDAHRQGDPLPPTQVVAYVDQIADALQYLHDRDLMHLDLKPANILLGAGGELLLSDFGLVQDVHNTASQSIPERVLGTPAFMDPGYMLGGPPRRASDQYALGVMVYEWLSGRRPFRDQWIADQHLHNARPQPLYGNISGISREIEQVVFRALEKDPNDRFPDVKAFAEAFARACGNSSPSSQWERQAFQSEKQALLRDKQALQYEKQGLQNKVNDIQRENQTLQREKETLQNKVNDIQREKQALQSKKQHWKNAYKELQSKMYKMDQNKQQSTVSDGTSSLREEGSSPWSGSKGSAILNLEALFPPLRDGTSSLREEGSSPWSGSKGSAILNLEALFSPLRDGTSSLREEGSSPRSTGREGTTHETEQQLPGSFEEAGI